MHPEPIINAATRLCAVFGHPIRHSASPAMQNAGIAALGLNWRYLACEVPPVQLKEAIEGARAMRFIGLNLTVPHKLLALNLVDELDDSARTWGAVNTVRFEGQDQHGQWVALDLVDPKSDSPIRARGFNTDADAMVQAIEQDLEMTLKGAQVWLLGAGGAGRTAALRLAAEGVASLWLHNRTESKCHEIQNEIRRRWPSVGTGIGYPNGKVDLILNATSLGLRADDNHPLDWSRHELKRETRVYDMIYRPAETPFLRHARERGCRGSNGAGMLLWQGAKALEIWSGRTAPVAAMRAALEAAIRTQEGTPA